MGAPERDIPILCGAILLLWFGVAMFAYGLSRAARQRQNKPPKPPKDDRKFYAGFGPTSDLSRVDWNPSGPTWLHCVGHTPDGREVWDNSEKYLSRDEIVEQQRTGRWLGMDPDKAGRHE